MVLKYEKGNRDYPSPVNWVSCFEENEQVNILEWLTERMFTKQVQIVMAHTLQLSYVFLSMNRAADSYDVPIIFQSIIHYDSWKSCTFDIFWRFDIQCRSWRVNTMFTPCTMVAVQGCSCRVWLSVNTLRRIKINRWQNSIHQMVSV